MVDKDMVDMVDMAAKRWWAHIQDVHKCETWNWKRTIKIGYLLAGNIENNKYN